MNLSSTRRKKSKRYFPSIRGSASDTLPYQNQICMVSLRSRVFSYTVYQATKTCSIWIHLHTLWQRLWQLACWSLRPRLQLYPICMRMRLLGFHRLEVSEKNYGFREFRSKIQRLQVM